MEGHQVALVVVAVLGCTVTLGTVLWRLASTIERVSSLVQRLTDDLDSHAQRLAVVEATRPTDATLRSSMEALRVEIERDALRRANEPRQACEGGRASAPGIVDPERSLRGRR